MKFLAAGLTTLLIAASAENADKPRTDPALDKLAVAFAEAFNAKDAARVASFYAEDAIVMAPDQTMIRGRRSVEAYYVRGFRQDVSNFRLVPIESRITGSHAFEAGTPRAAAREGVL